MSRKIFGFTTFIALVMIILFFVANAHITTIYTHLGDYYYKNNNLPSAQEYYEKAFELGCTDSSIREKYINSILLNSLNITMQKKLVKFLEYQVEDGATEKVRYFLYNLKEEILKKYPDNYIMQAPFNQKIVRWGIGPIKYGFNVTDEIPAYYISEIESAFKKWKTITSYKLMFERDDNSPDIVINFLPYNERVQENYKYVVAYTVPDIKGNRLEKVKIDFYITNPKGDFHSENKVYNVALHEIMHALGIYGHSYNREDIMSLSKIQEAEADDSRIEPSAADLNTLRLLYKIKPDITNSNNSGGEYVSSIILGNEYDIVTAKKIEAKNYVLQAPNLPSGYVDLAASYLDKKDYLNAIKNLERALERAQTDDMKSMVYYNLALTYYDMSNYTLAEDYLKKAQNLHNSENIKYLLAQVYADSQQTWKAETLYKELINNNPDNTEYVIGLTNIYINKKFYWEARKCLKNYFTAHPEEKNNPRFNSYGILKMFL